MIPLFGFLHTDTRRRSLRPRRTRSKLARARRNEVLWSNVETSIKDLEADVLLLFDCCHAGRLCQVSRGPEGYFEFFGSCTADQTTRSPGPESFTSALIWALKELAKEPKAFTTAKLQWQIKQHKHFPEHQVPSRSSRYNIGEIVIARRSLAEKLGNSDFEREEKERAVHHKESIDIRLHFDCLVRDDIVRQAADAMKALKENEKLRLTRIDFQGKVSLFEKAATIIRNRGASVVSPIDQTDSGLQMPFVDSPIEEAVSYVSDGDARIANTALKRTSKLLPTLSVTGPVALVPAGPRSQPWMEEESLAFHFKAIGWKLCMLASSSHKWLRIRVSPSRSVEMKEVTDHPQV